MSQAQLKMLHAYLDLMHTNAAAHVFRTAVELGVFDVLAAGPQQVAQIASAADVNPKALELLLDAKASSALSIEEGSPPPDGEGERKESLR